ncbi:hypothetical protein JW756_03625 [Candidatus Woesearchaeota archaeon]|nr:hypothetical protein [Candidatus Woesearchaeota archaeon]
MSNHVQNHKPLPKGHIGTFYRFGEPDQHEEHCAFRSREDMKRFVRLNPLPASEMRDIGFYQIQGRVVSDDGTPDGLTVMVEKYKRIKRL